MILLEQWLLFGGAALLMALTPGPNMIYLISRALCQGRAAAFVSLLGVVVGFVLHMCAAAVGLTSLFLAVPMAYETVKWAGAVYLLYLAWQAVRPDRHSLFDVRSLHVDSGSRLFVMGFVTNVLNPKIAVFYLAVFSQFVSTQHGSVLVQSLLLGAAQIAISFIVKLIIVLSAVFLARSFMRRPHWLAIQHYAMGGDTSSDGTTPYSLRGALNRRLAHLRGNGEIALLQRFPKPQNSMSSSSMSSASLRASEIHACSSGIAMM